jgi:hypothetical protein
MNDKAPLDPAGTGYQAPHKEYVVPSPKLKAFMVEDAQWERIKGRVSALEAKGGIDWLMAGGTSLAGIGASAGVALLVLPSATQGAQLDSGVKPTLWAVFIGGVVLSIVMFLLWRHLRDNKTKTASDICDEMSTIQEAWQEREGTDGP